MNQKSVNMLYLGVFLCLVCAIAAGVMGSVAVVTKEPIAKAKMKKISDGDRKSTRLNSSHRSLSRMPSSA